MPRPERDVIRPLGVCFLCSMPKKYKPSGAHAHLWGDLHRATWEEPFIWISLRSDPEYSAVPVLFWMEIGVHLEAPLEALDFFLREVWVECCGHLSEFRVGRKRYLREPEERGEYPMDLPVSEVFRPGTTFTYTYDFGSPTVIHGKVRDVFQGPAVDQNLWKGVVLLAMRNLKPRMTCSRCDQPARYLYAGEEGGPVELRCERHTPYGEGLPYVNSPRTGICAYHGPPPGILLEHNEEEPWENIRLF